MKKIPEDAERGWGYEHWQTIVRWKINVRKLKSDVLDFPGKEIVRV